jgi:DNA-binding transcriptional LysR family regulator
LLRISQPAASKQLADLEIGLGVTLVERRSRGVRLTAAGEVLGRHARRLFQEEQAAEAALEALMGLEAGHLAVASSTTIGSYIVPTLFGELHAAHPQIRLELEIGNAARVEELVLEGQLDLGLSEGLIGETRSPRRVSTHVKEVPSAGAAKGRVSMRPSLAGAAAKPSTNLGHEVLVSSDALEVEVFGHDQMVLIVAPGHPLAGGGSVTQAELRVLPIIVRERGSGTREVVEDALARRGIDISPVMSLGSTEAIKNAVAAGLGVALVSRLTLDLELQSGRLCALEVEGVSIRRALHLLTLESKPPSPVASEFLRLLRRRYPNEPGV